MYKIALLGVIAFFAGTVACSSAESSEGGESEGPVSAQHCGGFAGLTCSGGLFCDYGEMCGAADRLGTCRTKPRDCTMEYNPVCGCDNKTYSNKCTANGAGVAVAKTGTCAGAADECSTLGEEACNANSACEPQYGASCPICQDWSFRGCVKKTQPEVRPCGGHAGLRCGAEEFCNYNLEDMCGAADRLGKCETKPEECGALYDPVCGCDQKTYGSECDANGAGTSIFRKGACETK